MQVDPIKIISDYVRFPSVSTDPSYAEGMKGARDFLKELFAQNGFSVEEIPAKVHPVLLAERRRHPGAPTVIVYGHYDVQPADPFDLWATAPFEPCVKDGRLYGRGAADNKGPFMVHFLALARILEKEPDFPLNVILLVEGEEEIGSPGMPVFLRQHAHRLNGDVIMLSDSSSQSPEHIVITTGLRGLSELEVELKGPDRDLHSGMHGGAVLNPVQALVSLLASLHNEDGSVAVPGFYDDVVAPADWERDELRRLPLSQDAYRAQLGSPALVAAEGFTPFEATRFRPTLEFNGIGGGYQGPGNKTIIPSKAFAKITMRLVSDQDPDRIQQLVLRAIEARAPKGVQLSVRCGHGGSPYRVVPPGRPNTPADQSPVVAAAFAAAHSAITHAFGNEPLYLREGGSIPLIRQLRDSTGLDCLMIGLFLTEDNLHSPNESFHLGILERGLNMSESIFRQMAEYQT